MQHFSGWHLGMGLSANITGLLHGLHILSKDNLGCKAAALGMTLWGERKSVV